MAKKTDKQKLISKIDRAWSLAVRSRDNKCMLCGKTMDIKNLQAHHWIVSRARSLKYRYNIKNGVSLCYGCHICQIHHNPTVSVIEELGQRCIDSGIVTKQELTEIKNDRETVKYNLTDLKELLESLENI